MSARFWWVRHGPVPGPRTLRGQIDLPCDLSDTPRIALLRARLPADALVVASPLGRTRATAEAVMCRAPDLIEPGLIEQDFGLWSSRTWEEIGDEALALGFWDDPAQTSFPGGESFADQVGRVRETIFRLSKHHPSRDIACFCHAGTIRAALAIALGLEGKAQGKAFSFVTAPLSLTRIDLIEGNGEQGFRIEQVNERFPP